MVTNQIDKEKFMEFVSKAFDLDAHFNISFVHERFTEEFGKEISDEFANIAGSEVKEVTNKEETCRWFRADGKYGLSVFHKNSDKAE